MVKVRGFWSVLLMVALLALTISCEAEKEAAKEEKKEAPAEESAKKANGDSKKEVKEKPEEAAASPEEEKPALAGGYTNRNLEALLPAEFRGVKIEISDTTMGGMRPAQEGFVAASAMLEDDQGRRFANINFSKVQSLEFEHAQFKVKADGESAERAGYQFLGRQVGEHFAQRSYNPRMNSSEVVVLVKDQLSVRVSMENASSPDEAFELLKVIPLEELAKLAE